MRKHVKNVILSLATISFCAFSAVGVAACKSGEEMPPYTFQNPQVKADTDENVLLDGKFDDAIYSGNRWLTVNKNVGGETGQVRATTAFGTKGLYFAFEVTDSVSVKYTSLRDSFNNSCVEMYLTVNETAIETQTQYEIDLMPSGKYSVKHRAKSFSNDEWNMYAVGGYDPYLAATTVGELNTEDCHKYTLEFFVPYEFLRLSGAPQSVSIDPVLISSYGNGAKDGRNWCTIAKYDLLAYGSWANPATHYKFNADGLIGYDYTVQAEGGTVTETKGYENIIDNRSAKFEVKADNGNRIKTLKVNGVNYLDKICFENGKAVIDLTGAKENLSIAATFEAIPAQTVSVGGSLKNTTLYTSEQIDLKLFDGTNMYDGGFDAATGKFSASVPRGENYKLIVLRKSDETTLKEEKISLTANVSDKNLSTLTETDLLSADGVEMNAPLSGDGLTSVASENLGENFTLRYFLGFTDHLFPAASENANYNTHYAALRVILNTNSQQAFYTGLEVRGNDLAMWGDKPAVNFYFHDNRAKYSALLDYAKKMNGVTFVIDRQGNLVTAYAEIAQNNLVKLYETEIAGDVTGVSFYTSRVRTTATQLITENNRGVVKNMSVTINPDRAAERADGIYINEARELGLNGAKFTFTNKADPSVVYSGIVKNGRLAVADLVDGDYSVTAELIPGTTTKGEEFTIKNGAYARYEPYKMFRSAVNMRTASEIRFGEHNLIAMPEEGGANYGTGVKFNPISGEAYFGAAVKFTAEEAAKMCNAGTDSGFGIALFTSESDTYYGLQFFVAGNKLTMRIMQEWKTFATLGSVAADGTFAIENNEWKAVTEALFGNGIYLVQKKAENGALTFCFYAADKTTLLKEYVSDFIYKDKAGNAYDTICGVGTYRWKTSFAYSVSDYRVGKTLEEVQKIAAPEIAVFADEAKGSVTLSESANAPKFGEKVKVSVKANEGYIIVSITINGKVLSNGGEFTVTGYDEIEVIYAKEGTAEEDRGWSGWV